ncbi:MAG: tape measure protein, partial [Alphaproteobacteria bacterium]|nr:tape measure protein [Alphaproteobacteria bacterium]
MAEGLKLSVKITGDAKDLSGSLVIANKDINKLGRSVAASQKNLSQFEKAQNKAAKQSRSMASEVKFLTRAVAGLGLGLLTRQTYQAGEEFKSMTRIMESVTGSAEAAKSEYKWLSDEAERLGLKIRSTGKDYAGLMAASKGTNLEGEQTRKIFSAVSTAMTALGADAYTTSGALKAIEQMMSKGNVQAEELRGQLGERLKGALGLAAEAMGLTTAELNKMLDRGKLLAEDLLPKLADVMEKRYGEAAVKASKSATAEFNRLSNAIFEVQNEIAKGGLSEAAAQIFRDLKGYLSDDEIKSYARELGASIGNAAKKMAEGFKWAAEHGKELKAVLAGIIGREVASYIRGISVAIKSLTVAIAANPLGLLLVAVTTAVSAFMLFSDELVTVQGHTT